MTIFSALATSSTGLRTYRTWMDAVSDNIANLNTVRPTDAEAFRARFVVAEAVDYGTSGQPGIGGGSRVAGITYGDPTGRLVYEPDHPLADAEGYVRYPDIDLGAQMTNILLAQRGYQANLAVVERATQAYQAALQLGR
ncbi:MAG TPA: flagellar basal body rod protein FlgC [Egibacteraceae bacterium]|nr:flagellar basal body rod protein FlgC [Egibacteraceae bacterium]